MRGGIFAEAYSIAQVARKLGEPVTTLRYWEQQFTPWVTPLITRTAGGHRRFPPEAIAVLSDIQSRLRLDQASIAEVREALSTSWSGSAVYGPPDLPPLSASAERGLTSPFSGTDVLTDALGNLEDRVNHLERVISQFEEQYRVELEEVRTVVHYMGGAVSEHKTHRPPQSVGGLAVKVRTLGVSVWAWARGRLSL